MSNNELVEFAAPLDGWAPVNDLSGCPSHPPSVEPVHSQLHPVGQQEDLCLGIICPEEGETADKLTARSK